MKNTLAFNKEFNIDVSEFQMEVVAGDLVFLLKHSGVTRAQLAEKMNCKKSRITRILSGDENLTIKSITQVAEALGYAFDVVFYNKDYPKPKQPWEVDRERKKLLPKTKSDTPPERFTATIQKSESVVDDVLSGNEAEHYIRIDIISSEVKRNFKTISNQSILSVPNENQIKLALTTEVYINE